MLLCVAVCCSCASVYCSRVRVLQLCGYVSTFPYECQVSNMVCVPEDVAVCCRVLQLYGSTLHLCGRVLQLCGYVATIPYECQVSDVISVLAGGSIARQPSGKTPLRIRRCVQTRCNALQRTATHRNAPQRTATQCNALQQAARHCNAQHHTASCSLEQHGECKHTVTHCSVVQHAATRCNTLLHTAMYYNALQCTATRCNTLQHCITLQRRTSDFDVDSLHFVLNPLIIQLHYNAL